MFKNQKTLLAAGSVVALALSGAFAYAADDTSSAKMDPSATTDKDPNSDGKTSDRTPGNPSPDRTPNASSAGASGTDAGKTTEGTSDRTPEKKD